MIPQTGEAGECSYSVPDAPRRSPVPPSVPFRKMQNAQQSLSLERKVRIHEAREAIIDRLAATLPTTINLDRFLNVIVAELGRMIYSTNLVERVKD
jgi:hypothetical protein